eukprot:TRINITY_DN116519_c0_g1_i1.p1 TRINITY_DN116519_c0_g1~~TRINITY_DN116519_c0_g1_i1.p1  ORF type:complete len:281 (-),score=47.78 TRINITY_DN116519_c0_g1_i1:62-904(-)
MRVLLLLALVALVAGKYDGLGYELDRTFLIFKSQPTTVSAAKGKGFTLFGGNGNCKEGLGIAYQPKGGDIKSNSYNVWYTKGGQLTGFSVRTFSAPPSNLVGTYWIKVPGHNIWDITITTRPAHEICSGHTYDDEPVGTEIRINNRYTVPRTYYDAQQAGWQRGSCIPGMGTHFSWDLKSQGNMTWEAHSLMPVMPMYNVQTGNISAVLININNQQPTEPFAGDWEGPFSDHLWCLNWCKHSGCDWKGSSGHWSSMHWLFESVFDNSCHGAICNSLWPFD